MTRNRQSIGAGPVSTGRRTSLTVGSWRSLRTAVRSIVLIFALAVWMTPAWAAAAEPLAAPGDQRDRIIADDLLAYGAGPDNPIHNAYFLPVGEVGPALHRFSGTLSIPETRMQMSFALAQAQRWFPKVDLQLVSHGGRLIPVERDIVKGSGTESPWRLILSPGRVWSEAADGGLSRASFPFVLTGREFNESHNGLATFLFDDKRVSRLQFQIVQEAAPWNRFQAWGRLAATYSPGSVADPAVVTAAFEAELARRLPLRSWSELESRHDPEALAAFGNADKSQHVSASGLIVEDTIYLRPCATAFGDYPYCEEMRHGVFSVTKTLGALLALLRLAEKYGDEVFDLKLTDHLEISADHEGWQEVSFADALNMVTGVGDKSLDPASKETDEDSTPLFWRFAEVRSAQEKLEVAFSGNDYPWGPGEVFRYRSIDTFVLAAAMDTFLKSREGPNANLWDMVREEVLQPIGIDHAPIQHSDEGDGRRGLPILAWGFFPTVDDVAKLARLLQGGGRHQGRQLLSDRKLKEALYQTERRGMATPWDHYSYHLSFWHLSLPLEGCQVNVPQMMGYGGNIVQLLPQKMTSFYFQDSKTWPAFEIARAANAVRPLCGG